MSSNRWSKLTTLLETAMRGPTVGRDPRGRCDEMMAGYLGPGILRAFAGDGVTEIYVNPHDGLLWSRQGAQLARDARRSCGAAA
jgi:hypothetical protein